MFDRIEFLITEALVALRRNMLMTLAAISTVATALFLLGGLGYVYWRANASIQGVSSRFELRAFVRDGTSMEGIKATAAAIRKIPGVTVVNWIPKEKAWQRFTKQNPSLTEGLDNPFPDGFKVLVSDVALTRKVGSEIQSLPQIISGRDGVVFQEDEERVLNEMLGIARWVGGGLGSILFVTAAILIYNVIRLTVDGRRREIRLMQLVGATAFTVRTPFMIEGTVQGTVGGVLATFLILAANESLQAKVQAIAPTWNFPPYPIATMMLFLGAVGAIFGFICSWLAVAGPQRFTLRSGI